MHTETDHMTSTSVYGTINLFVSLHTKVQPSALQTFADVFVDYDVPLKYNSTTTAVTNFDIQVNEKTDGKTNQLLLKVIQLKQF